MPVLDQECFQETPGAFRRGPWLGHIGASVSADDLDGEQDPKVELAANVMFQRRRPLPVAREITGDLIRGPHSIGSQAAQPAGGVGYRRLGIDHHAVA